MRRKLVIPVKSLRRGKSRLAGTLSDAARESLNREFLAHALDVAASFPGLGDTIVVSPDPEALAAARARAAHTLRDPGGGLNAALHRAMAAARARGAGAALVLPTDLPWATAEDLAGIAGRGEGVVIVPDRRRAGTNALCIAPPAGFAFRFGSRSFAAHVAEARRAGRALVVADSRNLAFDVDTPADLALWRRAGGWSGTGPETG